jgi:hypothetical protein
MKGSVMKRRRSDYRLGPLVWAVGLVGVGSLLLLLNFDLLTRYEPAAQFLLAALLALVSAGFFLAAYASPREDWAQLIPAWTLVALAAMTLTSTFDTLDQRITAALLFVGLAAAFLHIYLLNRLDNWWALIPGGFMLVLAAVIGLSVRITRAETLAALLFAGLGLVFFALFAAPARRRQWWSLVPATVLVLFGVFVLTLDSDSTAGWLRWWPLLLIVVGVMVGVVGFRRQPAERMEINAAPARGKSSSSAKPPRAALGEYTAPAPGATVEILPDPDDRD